MSLQNLQNEFYDIIFSNDEQTTILYPFENMTIYRNNISTTLMKTLLTIYPMIVSLIGESLFHILAREYILQYPSRSGNLHEYGEYFCDFIEKYHAVKSLIYLNEVAKFEWYYHLLQFSADCPPFATQSLENLSPEQYDSLHFILHPASQVIKFDYPILRIIELCRGHTNESVNLNEGGINLLLIRCDLEIKFIPLSNGEFVFLSALRDNIKLSAALDAAMRADSTFNLEEKLLAWIKDKTIIDYYF